MTNPITRSDWPANSGSDSESIASGIWLIDDDRLVSVEDFDDGPSTVLVRSEDVLILTVELPPISSVAKRRAALPFAIEDRIAEPLEEVHVALGAEIGPNLHLAAIVRHDLMLRWVAMLNTAGLERASLVPDCIGLPVPGAGSWSVDLAGERAIVRTEDRTGFAIPFALLEPTWKSAGTPACISYGDSLPPDLHAPEATIEKGPLAERLVEPDVDLRQGPYAPPRKAIAPLWKRIATVAVLGALAHATIAVADTIVLGGIADDREEQVRALALTAAPSLALGPDLSTLVADLPVTSQLSGTSSAFLTLMTVTGTAFGQANAPAIWRSVRFDDAGQVLMLEIETDDPAGLEQVAAALAEAGMDVRPGAVSMDGGRAVGSFEVTPR
ncbi:MAG: type II secretion system protein GspL [Alteraurantiacibacter sp.]